MRRVIVSTIAVKRHSEMVLRYCRGRRDSRVMAPWQCDDCDIKRLDAVGITAEDWLDARTPDTTMVMRLVMVLQESLAEIERLATLLDVHLRACHDPHSATSPHLIGDDDQED